LKSKNSHGIIWFRSKFIHNNNLKKRGHAMTVDDFITEVFCFVDDEYKKIIGKKRLRKRGFEPKLTDSEVITMEITGEYLELNKDKHIWKYFKNNKKGLFPKIGSRSAFVKQSANNWRIKQIIHEKMRNTVQSHFHVIDGFPIPICHYSRSSRCKSLKGKADYGYCAAKDEKYYGFKGVILVNSEGMINSFTVVNPTVDERVALWDICTNIKGLLLGDKGFIGETLAEELRKHEVYLETQKRVNMKESRPIWFLNFIRTKRKIVETVISQLSRIFNIQNFRVRDLWHFTNRITRKVLAHNLCTMINLKYGLNPLSIEPLVN
jgi:hypothetical protein